MTHAIKLSVSSDGNQVSVPAVLADLLLYMKYAKATNLFLMDLILIRLPVKRLVLGLEFILTSPKRINNSNTNRLTYLKGYDPGNISLCCQKRVVNIVETWVNARFKLYCGNRRQTGM